jgi:hypothetical protein
MRLALTLAHLKKDQHDADSVRAAVRDAGVASEEIYQINIGFDRKSPEQMTRYQMERWWGAADKWLPGYLPPQREGVRIRAYLDFEPNPKIMDGAVSIRDLSQGEGDPDAWRAWMTLGMDTMEQARPDVDCAWWGFPDGTSIPGPFRFSIQLARLMDVGILERSKWLCPCFYTDRRLSTRTKPGAVSGEDLYAQLMTGVTAAQSTAVRLGLTESAVVPYLCIRHYGQWNQLDWVPRDWTNAALGAFRQLGIDTAALWYGVDDVGRRTAEDADRMRSEWLGQHGKFFRREAVAA